MTYEIGKTYRVPCARIVWLTGKADWIPVVGPRHSDPQFANDTQHYHIDTRFVKNLGRHGTITPEGTTSYVIWADDRYWNYKVTGIYPRLRRCHRSLTGIFPMSNYHPEKTAPRWEQWALSMIGQPCRGKRCPHRGAEMQEVNGLLLCPLHNLAGCPATETIIGAWPGKGPVCRKKLISMTQ